MAETRPKGFTLKRVKSFFKRIKNEIFNFGLSDEDFRNVRGMVANDNRQYLVSWSIGCSVFWLMSLILSFSKDSFQLCRFVYASALGVCFITYILGHFVIKRVPSLLTFSMFFFSLSHLAAGIGIAICQPDVRTVTMIALVIITPVCFVNRTITNFAVDTGVVLGYAIVAKNVIIYDVFRWGLENLIIFSIAGLFVGHFCNKARMKRFIFESSAKRLVEMESWYESKILVALKNAVRNRSLRVYYQPIYDTNMNCILTAEALVRLDDPILGLVTPDKFIPLAEKNGLIKEIGDFVFEEVCSFLDRHRGNQYAFTKVEVNLSVLQCADEELPDRWDKIMKKYNVTSQQFCLEITESAMLSTSSNIGKVIRTLRERGFSFALDDYGTGFANDSIITEFPFDLIKIDKSIVWGADNNEKGDKVLHHIISMIHDLDMKIVAEGVETEEQRKKLENAKVEYLQGFLFSKPVPEMEAISASSKSFR